MRQPDPPAPDREPERCFEVSILPVGNLLGADAAAFHQRRRASLGHFSVLSDALIVAILDTLATTSTSAEARGAARALCHFSEASTCTHAMSSDDDLWRRLAFSVHAIPELCAVPFHGSWRNTLLHALCTRTRTRTGNAIVQAPPSYYSDILFHKRRCRLALIDDAWVAYDDVPRVPASTVSVDEFRQRFEMPRRPVILTGLATGWEASKSWTVDALQARLGDTALNAGGFSFTFDQYVRYVSHIHRHDDQALYIFDKNFAAKAPHLARDYKPPHFFAQDLFSVLGGDGERPDYRWLIIGPARSGSSFHKDPNATSAWNAAVRGRKKWVFFPPDVTPPGVSPTSDGSNVTCPLSIVEWFINYYDRAAVLDSGGLEATLNPGEIMFVPRGWWHCVLNLDFSIAITQNFVTEVNVRSVVQWLHEHPDQISGCNSAAQVQRLISNFPKLVVQKHPHLRDKLSFALPGLKSSQESVDDDDKNIQQSALAHISKKRKVNNRSGLWQSLQTTSSLSAKPNDHVDANASKFTFGFTV